MRYLKKIGASLLYWTVFLSAIMCSLVVLTGVLNVLTFVPVQPGLIPASVAFLILLVITLIAGFVAGALIRFLLFLRPNSRLAQDLMRLSGNLTS